MSKKRYVNTSFWRDNYICNLDPSEKLVFLYLITNPDTNISGIYQIPLKIISTDTGFDKEMVIKIINRFTQDHKIKYENGWIAIKNFIKNQNERSPQVVKGIKNELSKAPESLKTWIAGEGIDTLSHLDLDLNLNSDLDLNSDLNKKTSEQSLEKVTNFLQFWNEYDKKVNRTKCEKLWNKINPDVYPIIFAHITAYVKATPDKKFRKNPETYLYNQCWNDEIITANNTPVKPEYNDTLKRLEEKYGSC